MMKFRKGLEIFISVQLLVLFTNFLCSPGHVRATEKPALPEAEAIKHCAPRTVDIEIRGRDQAGQWVSHAAGTILHEDGYILTCEHVTYPGESQQVILSDGTVYPFKVLARAGGSYDTAILKIEPRGKLPAVRLGHSDEVSKGQKVMVIGNPAGRRHTISRGIIDRKSCGGGTQIQIVSVDIGPGNSGGPVFNDRGEQIAHVHVKISTAINTSRHIRVDHTRDAFAKVFSNEDRHDYLIGITVDCQGDKAQVLKVHPDSPASKAGIKEEDVVTKIAGMKIDNGVHYGLALISRVGKESIPLTIRRGEAVIKKTIQPCRHDIKGHGQHGK
ncbi:MAG: trypsin-like peptidase domain-containing protein [Verrucomicrobiales bacterium]